MNRNKLFAVLSLCLVSNFLAGQAYEIKVKILNYNRDTLLFGYHYGDKQYIKDTAFRKNNEFVFKRDTVLEPGMYLIVTQPEHDFFQILIDKDKQKFSIETKLENLTTNLKFKGSKLNSDFLDYIGYVSKRRVDADSIGLILKQNKDTLHTKFLGANAFDENSKSERGSQAI